MTSAIRVAHVVATDSFAGVERYVCDVASELYLRGCSVVVIGGEDRTMRRELPAGITHLTAHTTMQATRRLLSIGRCDIVHAHMTAAEIAAVTSRPSTRARVVCTRHFAATRGSSWPVRTITRAIVKGITRQIAISGFVAGATGEQVTVLHNGVPTQKPCLDLSARAVLVIQRLEAEKDTATAITAWARCGLARDGWRLVIVGRGSQRRSLEDLSRQLQVSDSVEFAGFVDDPGRVRSEAGLFLATAPAEPFGLSVVEAMAAGLPVVAADGGAHRETLADTGLFYPPGDADACAALLLRLAASPELRWHMGLQARERQRLHLSLAAHVDELETIYRGVTR